LHEKSIASYKPLFKPLFKPLVLQVLVPQVVFDESLSKRISG